MYNFKKNCVKKKLRDSKKENKYKNTSLEKKSPSIFLDINFSMKLDVIGHHCKFIFNRHPNLARASAHILDSLNTCFTYASSNLLNRLPIFLNISKSSLLLDLPWLISNTISYESTFTSTLMILRSRTMINPSSNPHNSRSNYKCLHS